MLRYLGLGSPFGSCHDSGQRVMQVGPALPGSLNVNTSKLPPLAFLSRFFKAPGQSGLLGGQCPGLDHGGSFLVFPTGAWLTGPQPLLLPGPWELLTSGLPGPLTPAPSYTVRFLRTWGNSGSFWNTFLFMFSC